MGANVFRPRPTQRDPLRASAQVRKRDPRFGFAQIRARPPGLLRDEEAVGSNPAHGPAGSLLLVPILVMAQKVHCR